MRVGQNPNKNLIVDGYYPVVLAVVTHLPNSTTAYHSRRFEVIQNCLKTMRAGAGVDHTFIVWDNGSIPQLQNWIENEFKPDIFVKSANIGKINARTSMAGMVHPESIFCYSDDDMLFYDNWLKPQIDLLENFPNVSVVTGYPVRTAFRWGIENTKKWAMENARFELGRFIPQEWEDDFALSVGRTPEWHKNYTKDDVDYRITYNGKQAYATAHHCQFISRAGTIAKMKYYDNYAMGGEKPFDIAMDNIGLRLATTQRVARHIGNVIDEKIKMELETIGA